ncbi:hypothetical protein HT031_003448 [Scenedesmus sp. PABB004]|nr:hypothetical protein HT031_003448 [Scenedesmus sp. PABB004]
MLRQPAARLLARCLSLQPISSGAPAAAGQVVAAAAAAAAATQAQAAAAPARAQQQQRRALSSSSDWQAEVDLINEKFAEAREEIEMARDDAETVYFNESAELARNVVGEVLERWGGLLASLPDEEAAKLQRSMGLKIEQLKAELKELDELHA